MILKRLGIPGIPGIPVEMRGRSPGGGSIVAILGMLDIIADDVTRGVGGDSGKSRLDASDSRDACASEAAALWPGDVGHSGVGPVDSVRDSNESREDASDSRDAESRETLRIPPRLGAERALPSGFQAFRAFCKGWGGCQRFRGFQRCIRGTAQILWESLLRRSRSRVLIADRPTPPPPPPPPSPPPPPPSPLPSSTPPFPPTATATATATPTPPPPAPPSIGPSAIS